MKTAFALNLIHTPFSQQPHTVISLSGKCWFSCRVLLLVSDFHLVKEEEKISIAGASMWKLTRAHVRNILTRPDAAAAAAAAYYTTAGVSSIGSYMTVGIWHCIICIIQYTWIYCNCRSGYYVRITWQSQTKTYRPKKKIGWETSPCIPEGSSFSPVDK